MPMSALVSGVCFCVERRAIAGAPAATATVGNPSAVGARSS
jgi:hypothetical protein